MRGIVKTSINARVERDKIERKERRMRARRRRRMCIEGASAVRICWFTGRARVYIIILDAGYTYLYKEGLSLSLGIRTPVSAAVSLWLIATL